jgi:hypothetical protein
LVRGLRKFCSQAFDGGELLEMNMEKIAPIDSSSNPDQENLTASDRQLLVRASLCLFLRRLNHGIPVFRDDLLRIAYYAPEEAPR